MVPQTGPQHSWYCVTGIRAIIRVQHIFDTCCPKLHLLLMIGWTELNPWLRHNPMKFSNLIRFAGAGSVPGWVHAGIHQTSHLLSREHWRQYHQQRTLTNPRPWLSVRHRLRGGRAEQDAACVVYWQDLRTR